MTEEAEAGEPPLSAEPYIDQDSHAWLATKTSLPWQPKPPNPPSAACSRQPAYAQVSRPISGYSSTRKNLAIKLSGSGFESLRRTTICVLSPPAESKADDAASSRTVSVDYTETGVLTWWVEAPERLDPPTGPRINPGQLRGRRRC
jgi:hypothetical protein